MSGVKRSKTQGVSTIRHWLKSIQVFNGQLNRKSKVFLKCNLESIFSKAIWSHNSVNIKLKSSRKTQRVTSNKLSSIALTNLKKNANSKKILNSSTIVSTAQQMLSKLTEVNTSDPSSSRSKSPNVVKKLKMFWLNFSKLQMVNGPSDTTTQANLLLAPTRALTIKLLLDTVTSAKL